MRKYTNLYRVALGFVVSLLTLQSIDAQFAGGSPDFNRADRERVERMVERQERSGLGELKKWDEKRVAGQATSPDPARGLGELKRFDEELTAKYDWDWLEYDRIRIEILREAAKPQSEFFAKSAFASVNGLPALSEDGSVLPGSHTLSVRVTSTFRESSLNHMTSAVDFVVEVCDDRGRVVRKANLPELRAAAVAMSSKVPGADVILERPVWRIDPKVNKREKIQINEGYGNGRAKNPIIRRGWAADATHIHVQLPHSERDKILRRSRDDAAKRYRESLITRRMERDRTRKFLEHVHKLRHAERERLRKEQERRDQLITMQHQREAKAAEERRKDNERISNRPRHH